VAALPPRVQAYHPSSYRWILMRDYLRALPREEAAGALFFTDVRDTVFQADPFAAAAYANAAAALSTLGYGAVAPIPQRAAVEDFIAA
jgi:sugar/nucleoside kinase (ribokinase family)